MRFVSLQVAEIMFPNTRGKRFVEISLQNTNKKLKKDNLSSLKPAESNEKNEDANISVLDISDSQLIGVPDDANMSFSLSDISDLSAITELSSSLKVANFVLNHEGYSSIGQDRSGASSNILYAEYTDENRETAPSVDHVDERPEEVSETMQPTDVVALTNVAPTIDHVDERPEEVSETMQPTDVVALTNVAPTIDHVDERPEEVSETMQPTDVVALTNVAPTIDHVDERPEEVSETMQPIDVVALTNVAPTIDHVDERPEEVSETMQPTEQSEPNDLGEAAQIDSQVGKTRIIDTSHIAKKKTKKLEKKDDREHGKAYLGRYYDKEKKSFVEVMKEAKVLGDRCKCKAAYYHCKEISDQDREKIFTEVWRMTWCEKEVFVKMAIEAKDVKERKGAQEQSKRDKTLYFTLRGSNGSSRVCKDMFLKTTGLTSWMIRTTLSGTISENADSSSQSQHTQSEQSSTRKPPLSDGRLFLQEFFQRLPKMPAHYCRKDTSKLYLEASFKSAADVYREYKRMCTEQSRPIMSMTIFTEQLKAENIAIFTPRKDQCDLCCEYAQGNATEDIYNKHRARKEAAQTEKAQDKNQPANSRTMVLCVDVQRVLLSPCLKASALYYKTKLQVHNYTVFDMCSKNVVCYLWNEAEGGLTGNEFASCLVHYLTDKKDTFDRAIIYSDGCTYQNRNRILGTALRYFCVSHQKIVEQKILERGHTQMEVDSVHATVERKLKNVDIYSPLDYVQLVQAARTNPCPYEVQYLTYDFFKDFDNFEGAVRSLKPSKNANVTNMCALKYLQDGTISYKLNFSDDWEDIALGRNTKLPSKVPSQLYHGRRKIKKSKFDHLQSLKSVLPADVHAFYDSLQHS